MQTQATTEVTRDLQDKLKVMDREAEFATLKPNKPYRWWPIAMSGVAAIGFGVLAYLYWRRKPDEWPYQFWMCMFLTLQFVSQVNQYLAQRKLFRMYAMACELIDYYRGREAGH